MKNYNVFLICLLLAACNAQAMNVFDVISSFKGAHLCAAKFLGKKPISKDIWQAAMNGKRSDIRMFVIADGVSPDALDGENNTPLARAASHGNTSMCKTLLKMKANINAPSGKFKDTPLHCASNWADLPTMKLLVKRKADLNAGNCDGNTPLHCAAIRGMDTSVQFLIDSKALVNAIDRRGKTPLMSACVFEHLEIVKLLLGAQADPTIKDNLGIKAGELVMASQDILALLQPAADGSKRSQHFR